MAKIFARERTKYGKGAGKPRFAIVAVEGLDLKIYHSHVRLSELEALAESVAAELVYLPRGSAGEGDGKQAGGKKKRKRKGDQG